MGRKLSPVDQKVKGIQVPVSLDKAIAEVPGLKEKTISFWLSLLSESKRKVVEADLKKLRQATNPAN